MGGRQKDPEGLLFSHHIGNLKRSLLRIADELNRDQSEVTVRVYTPELDDAGMITSRVFGLLDTAELGIMDVSAGSASVMYELAMLHALGTPTIPVLFSNSKSPYYLKETYQARVDSFEEGHLYEKLRAMVRTVVVGGGLGSDPAMNPMTTYYGLPMVDISASTGLATGYFHNFLRHVLKSNGSVFDFVDSSVEKLIVIRPQSLAEAEGLKQATERRLRSQGIEVEYIGEKDGKVYEDREQARGQILIYRAGRFLFDAPTPLAAQEKSPRMKRIRKQLIPASGRGTASEEAKRTVEKFEERMIDDFMSVLRRLPEDYPGSRADRLEFASLDQFIEMARV